MMMMNPFERIISGGLYRLNLPQSIIFTRKRLVGAKCRKRMHDEIGIVKLESNLEYIIRVQNETIFSHFSSIQSIFDVGLITGLLTNTILINNFNVILIKL